MEALQVVQLQLQLEVHSSHGLDIIHPGEDNCSWNVIFQGLITCSICLMIS